MSIGSILLNFYIEPGKLKRANGKKRFFLFGSCSGSQHPLTSKKTMWKYEKCVDRVVLHHKMTGKSSEGFATLWFRVPMMKSLIMSLFVTISHHKPQSG